MLTEWDAAVSAILDQKPDEGPKGLKVLLDMCADESDEMKHRGFACLVNVINAPGDVGKKGIMRLRSESGVPVLQNALKATQSRQVMEVGVEVLKKVM